jgi:glyoxylase-like metal-dependent hydrolase (beta-lactamase superfamily II)
MVATRLILGALDTNCWVAGDDSDGPVIVIDPADDAQAILTTAGERGVAAIVLTHGHFDHLGAVRELVEVTGAPLCVHEDDAANITHAEGTGGAPFGFSQTAPAPNRVLRDGDVIEAGDLGLLVLHTPGHTPGGICLYAEGFGSAAPELFAGDTVFAGSVGRTDFPDGDARALARSIAEKITPLPAETIIHPGHGPDTTVGRERRLNPFFPRA